MQTKVQLACPQVYEKQTYLEDEYLHCIETNDDQRFFYVRATCCYSYRKNDTPHELKVALCIITADVMKATCSCVAGGVGYCNHILALLLKLCKFIIFECQTWFTAWLSNIPWLTLKNCESETRIQLIRSFGEPALGSMIIIYCRCFPWNFSNFSYAVSFYSWALLWAEKQIQSLKQIL